MLKLAILDDYQRAALDAADWSKLSERAEITVFDRAFGSLEEAQQALAPFDIVCLMRERTPFPRALIEALPKLKLITLTGGRSPSLDAAAATEHGITISHTGGGGGEHATVELAWALVLATVRHLAFEDAAMRKGGWQTTIGTTLHGKVLGLLGAGKLGSRVGAIGRAFGMETIAWSENLTAEKAEAAGFRRVEKDALFRSADVLSIHLVLSDRSRGLVGARELGLMKKSAYLINTSRGPIVEEAALVAALREGRIAGAGLDVYDREPLPSDHPLRSLPNTVLSPHLGFVSRESYAVFYGDTVEDVLAWLDGAPVRVLNPAVLDGPRRMPG
ncbi:MAG TPA: D-2-hydroxyacid dehydrogenase family protein [Aliidongia sp.]|nr:D-2-hydroxyacid dehydrogenase family protein [Aliidongia sp.]